MNTLSIAPLIEKLAVKRKVKAITKAAKKGKFKTGSFGMLKPNELGRIKLLPNNRTELGYDPKHVNNMKKDDWKCHKTGLINQDGYILDGSNRYRTAIEMKQPYIYTVVTDESLNTNDLSVLAEYSASLNERRRVKGWSKFGAYERALTMKKYTLAFLIKKEIYSIESIINSLLDKPIRIEHSWVGGLMIGKRLDKQTSRFTSLEIYRNEEYVTKAKSKEYKIRKQAFIDLFVLIKKKGFSPRRIVAQIIEDCTMPDGRMYVSRLNEYRSKLVGYKFVNGFNADYDDQVKRELKRILKQK